MIPAFKDRLQGEIFHPEAAAPLRPLDLQEIERPAIDHLLLDWRHFRPDRIKLLQETEYLIQLALQAGGSVQLCLDCSQLLLSRFLLPDQAQVLLFELLSRDRFLIVRIPPLPLRLLHATDRLPQFVHPFR